MKQENEDLDFQSIQNHITEKDRRLEAVKFAIKDGNFRNRRRFLTYFDGNPDYLNSIGLIEDGKGGTPIVIDRYNNRDWVPLGGGDAEEQANRFLKHSLEELQDAGYEIPFEIEGDLFDKCKDHRDWLSEVCSEVWFGRTEKAELVSDDEFGYPLVTHMSKKFSMSKKLRDKIEEELGEELEQVSTDFIEMFDELQSDSASGIYTAITKRNESLYRWIYGELRQSSLNSRQIADVLLEVEQEIKRGELTPERLQKVIIKIQDRDSGDGVPA